MDRNAVRLVSVLACVIVIFLAPPAPSPADLAHGTRVTLASGAGQELRPVEQIGFKDYVYALVQGAQGPEWKAKKVIYSYGTGPDTTEPTMVRLAFGAAESQAEIAVTDRHLFLVIDGATGKIILKRANRLVPGADMLMNPEGKPVPLRSISFRTSRGGTHHVATSTNLDDTWDGHLIITNGIISGDYLLQVAPPQ
ncbi:MAG: hypothetical protein NT045_06265 [Candidatus Aureabacteria bacterium]|nr:hypothetical protein [Candidatus Auribacterota bacterium]